MGRRRNEGGGRKCKSGSPSPEERRRVRSPAPTTVRPPSSRTRQLNWHEEIEEHFPFMGYIASTEHRGITLPQLRRVVFYARDRCEKWKDERLHQKLSMDRLNLYHLNARLIKPATKAMDCAFVELLSRKLQTPLWFVSHWWGERIADFLNCVEVHVVTRGLTKESPYWVCAYANRQHALQEEVTDDPRDTSFFKAMELAKGVLLILDDEGPATAFTRIWCAFEESVALEFKAHREVPMLLDIAACYVSNSGKSTELLTEGLTDEEKQKEKLSPGSGVHAKTMRECSFPLEVVKAGLTLELEKASATEPKDRTRILNCLAGRDLDEEPPLEQHENYTRVNMRLRAVFAAAVWRHAAEKGMVQELKLPQVLAGDRWRKDLAFDFREAKIGDDDIVGLAGVLSGAESLQTFDLSLVNCPSITDASMRTLASSLPSWLQSLNLDLRFCRNIGDDGLEGFSKGLPVSLQMLVLDFEGCDKITHVGFLSVVRGFPAKLQHLTLSFEDCDDQLDDYLLAMIARGLPSHLKSLDLNLKWCNSITDVGIVALSQNLPQSLLRLTVKLSGKGKMGNIGIATFAEALPNSLEKLDLNLDNLCCISDEGFAALAKHLPEMLRVLRLKIKNCDIRDPGLAALAQGLPIGLEELMLNLTCDNIGDAGLASLARGLPSELLDLTIDLRCCELISNIGLVALGDGLPDRLTSLDLDLGGCEELSDEGLATFMHKLHMLWHLQHLTLNFSCCSGIGDRGAAAIARALPPAIQTLNLDLQNTGVSEHKQECCESLVFLREWNPPAAIAATPARHAHPLVSVEPATPVFNPHSDSCDGDMKVMNAFRKWDKDGCGTISKPELSKVLATLDPKLTDEDVDRIFNAADTNGSGDIDYQEFVEWLFNK